VAILKQRWSLAGLFWGLTIMAHFSALAPVGLSILVVACFNLRPSTWKTGSNQRGGFEPWVITELVFFAYGGRCLFGQRCPDVISRYRRFRLSARAWLWVVSSTLRRNGLVLAAF